MSRLQRFLTSRLHPVASTRAISITSYRLVHSESHNTGSPPTKRARHSAPSLHPPIKSMSVNPLTGSAAVPAPEPIIRIKLSECRDPRGGAIELSETESALFDRVLSAVNGLNLDCQVRVAGGWVRDKLLGVASDDIDFVLDTMSGIDFANAISTFLLDPSNKSGSAVSSIATIKANPDQSKHLETATFVIDGISIDANRYRDEVYTENSRIPEIKVSTAKEDAERRDFTVNALFYNIHTGEVEDYVNGMKDLANRVLRTPTDPFKTFSDDPLRVIRAVRFAARLHFDVDPLLVEAAKSQQVHANILSKVSRERVGIELRKMIDNSVTFLHALQLITQWNLRSSMFLIDTSVGAVTAGAKAYFDSISDSDAELPHQSLSTICLQCSELAHQSIVNQSSYYETNHQLASFLLLYSYLAPYHGFTIAVKKRTEPLVGHIFATTIKWPGIESKRIVDVSTQAYDIETIAYEFQNQALNSEEACVRFGRCLYLLGPHHWRLGLDLAKSFEYLRANSESNSPLATHSINQSVANLESHMLSHSSLFSYPIHELKPHLTGDQMLKILSMRPGPAMGRLKDAMIDWQIRQLHQPIDQTTKIDSSDPRYTEQLVDYLKTLL